MMKFVAVVASTAAAISLESANAWRSVKEHSVPNNVAFQAPFAFIETQWGAPYTTVAATEEDDGSLTFKFADAILGVVTGEVPEETEGGGEGTPEEEPADSPGSCAQEDLSAVGPYNFETLEHVDSFQKCRTICLEDQRCNWLTYNTDTRRCFLKSSRGGAVRYGAMGDLTSPKFCDSSCFEKDTAMNGTPITTVNSPNGHDCHYNCYMTSGCELWSWNEQSQQCSLYSAGEQKKRTRAEGVWMGPRDGCGSEAAYPAGLATPGSCMQRDLSAVGPYEFRQQPNVENVGECQKLCLEDPKCNWVTYNVDGRYCYLKSSRGGELKFSKVGDLTGPKFCDTSCFRKNAEMNGTPMTTVDSPTGHDCHYNCYMNEDCVAWSWNGQSKRCALYDGGDLTQARKVEGIWSGPPRGCGKESTYEAGPKAS